MTIQELLEKIRACYARKMGLNVDKIAHQTAEILSDIAALDPKALMELFDRSRNIVHHLLEDYCFALEGSEGGVGPENATKILLAIIEKCPGILLQYTKVGDHLKSHVLPVLNQFLAGERIKQYGRGCALAIINKIVETDPQVLALIDLQGRSPLHYMINNRAVSTVLEAVEAVALMKKFAALAPGVLTCQDKEFKLVPLVSLIADVSDHGSFLRNYWKQNPEELVLVARALLGFDVPACSEVVVMRPDLLGFTAVHWLMDLPCRFNQCFTETIVPGYTRASRTSFILEFGVELTNRLLELFILANPGVLYLETNQKRKPHDSLAVVNEYVACSFSQGKPYVQQCSLNTLMKATVASAAQPANFEDKIFGFIANFIKEFIDAQAKAGQLWAVLSPLLRGLSSYDLQHPPVGAAPSILSLCKQTILGKIRLLQAQVLPQQQASKKKKKKKASATAATLAVQCFEEPAEREAIFVAFQYFSDELSSAVASLLDLPSTVHNSDGQTALQCFVLSLRLIADWSDKKTFSATVLRLIEDCITKYPDLLLSHDCNGRYVLHDVMEILIKLLRSAALSKEIVGNFLGIMLHGDAGRKMFEMDSQGCLPLECLCVVNDGAKDKISMDLRKFVMIRVIDVGSRLASNRADYQAMVRMLLRGLQLDVTLRFRGRLEERLSGLLDRCITVLSLDSLQKVFDCLGKNYQLATIDTFFKQIVPLLQHFTAGQCLDLLSRLFYQGGSLDSISQGMSVWKCVNEKIRPATPAQFQAPLHQLLESFARQRAAFGAGQSTMAFFPGTGSIAPDSAAGPHQSLNEEARGFSFQ